MPAAHQHHTTMSKPQTQSIWQSLTQQRSAFIRIGIALLLLAIGILSENNLHNKPYGYIEYILFLSAYLLVGYKVLYAALRNIWHGEFFDENTLMSVATIGAIAIHQLPEAVAVMLFYSIGETLQDVAVHRSRRSISALLAIRPDKARVLRNDHDEIVHPEDVAVGEVISVFAGERIPLDGEVTQGESFVDTSALTGESIPRHVSVSQPVLAGMVATSGLLLIKVSKPYSESSLARILHLVEEAGDRKAHTEKVITAFSHYYTPAVVGAATALALLPPLLFGANFTTWLYRALILLVISCPCALVLSVPLSYFGGIGACARHGVLIKGASYLDTLARLSTVTLDKTGTLTEGSFKVTAVHPSPPFSASELLAMAASVEAASKHPIAAAIIAAHDGAADAQELDIHKELAGRGVKGQRNGTVILAGNDLLMHQEQVTHPDAVCTMPGTVVHVAVDNQYAGNIVIADELRPAAHCMVNELRQLGINHLVMLTGDDTSAAEVIGRQLGMDAVYANLLPVDKVARIEELAAKIPPGRTLAFVGDGINDAPVLSRADVGVAMGGLGSDAAIEAADVVILEDQLTKLPMAIKISKRTRTLVFQNIAFSLGVKGLFLALGAAGAVTIWGAVFADVGVSLLAVLNATRILRFSPDHSQQVKAA